MFYTKAFFKCTPSQRITRMGMISMAWGHMMAQRCVNSWACTYCIFFHNGLDIDIKRLYRDDGSTAQVLSKKQADRARKYSIAIFESCGFTITVEINLPKMDMLDVTFVLPSGKYLPYRKPNNEPFYIYSKSNSPPSILKHLPKNSSDRLSSISSDEAEFDKANPGYEH